MKSKTLLIMALAAAGGGAWLLLQPQFGPRPVTVMPASETVDRVEEVEPVSARQIASAGTTEVAAAPVRARPGSTPIDEQAARAAGCTPVTRYLPVGDGTTVEVYECQPDRPRAPHPYESYSNEALEALAYSDADAARILGMRLRYSDEQAAISLTLRASALSGGDAEPIVAFSNAYPHPAFVNYEPVVKTIRVKYVLNAVTELLGDDRNGLAAVRTSIRAHFADPDAELARLDRRARELFEEMQRIELEVTGTSTIGG